MLNKSKESLRTEKYPLPTTVEGILSILREVLSGGRVRRIELDTDLPIKVIREVETSSECHEPDMDLDAALHKVEMLECSGEPMEAIAKMTRQLYRRNLFPCCWVIGPSSLLDTWAHPYEPEFYAGQDYFLNVPVRIIRSLASDTLILCGSQYKNADAEDIDFAVKTSMELRRDYESESSGSTADPVWSGPKKRDSAIGGLEIPTFGFGSSGGTGSSNSGK